METFVYVLLSLKDGQCYVGISNNLLRRYWQHSTGFVASTKGRRPLIMVHWERFSDKKQAMKREKWLKSPVAAEYKASLRRMCP